ncbi:hypothetical protein F2Q68_00038946 [Brassica cretica]|uniref:Uncharacterized protein n=1 Tax=Brassica cretica TaxID=69181 RepID=A0A8S9MHR4_BRACR|nr:hypothetical protein F2Q68_00038946 [Brassica cretica]
MLGASRILDKDALAFPAVPACKAAPLLSSNGEVGIQGSSHAFTSKLEWIFCLIPSNSRGISADRLAGVKQAAYKAGEKGHEVSWKEMRLKDAEPDLVLMEVENKVETLAPPEDNHNTNDASDLVTKPVGEIEKTFFPLMPSVLNSSIIVDFDLFCRRSLLPSFSTVIDLDILRCR